MAYAFYETIYLPTLVFFDILLELLLDESFPLPYLLSPYLAIALGVFYALPLNLLLILVEATGFLELDEILFCLELNVDPNEFFSCL